MFFFTSFTMCCVSNTKIAQKHTLLDLGNEQIFLTLKGRIGFMPVGNGPSGQPIHYWRLDAETSFAGHVYVPSLLVHERGMNRSRLCHFTLVSKHSVERVIFVSNQFMSWVCCMLLCLGHCRWGLTRASIFEFRSSIVCSSGRQLDVNRWYFNDPFPG